jgi:hypothetical protein
MMHGVFDSFVNRTIKTMNTYPIYRNAKPTACYNKEEIPSLFKIHIDVTLSGLKDRLDHLNSHLNYQPHIKEG